MPEGHEPAVLLSAQLHALVRFGTVSGDGETLIARGHQLERPADLLRRHRHDGSALGERAARAEGAAHEGRDRANLLRRDAQLMRNAVLDAIHVLARFPHGEPVAVPGAGGGEKLQRVVVLGAGFVH